MVWELASISPIRDEAGVVTHFVSVKEDFTEIKRLQDRMDNLAHHDQLTGLPNRTLFYDRLKQAQALAKRREEGLALFYLDLDGFKAVNDTHGHELGDRLLKAVGQRLMECVRESDTVARIGGDEFTVLLPGLHTQDTAADIARLIIEALSRPFQLDHLTCAIGVSIGISFYPRDSEDGETHLLRRRRHVQGEEQRQEQLRLLGVTGAGAVPGSCRMCIQIWSRRQPHGRDHGSNAHPAPPAPSPATTCGGWRAPARRSFRRHKWPRTGHPPHPGAQGPGRHRQPGQAQGGPPGGGPAGGHRSLPQLEQLLRGFPGGGGKPGLGPAGLHRFREGGHPHRRGV